MKRKTGATSAKTKAKTYKATGKAKAKAKAADKAVGKAARALRRGGVRVRLRHRGMLGQFGYRGVKTLTQAQRHAALTAAAVRLGPTVVIRRLSVLAVFTKNKDPKLSGVYRSDMAFVQGLRNAE